jgi:hypothetical protein
MGIIRRTLGITIIVVLLVSVGLLMLPVACTSPGGTLNLPPSKSVSGLVEKLTLDDLAARADLVLLGKAVDVTGHEEASGNVYTLVTFSVEQFFKGETANQVVVSVPGGKLDGQIQVVEDAPSFQLGERVVVFLEKGDGIFRVLGGFQGKFTIDKNNMVGNVPLQEFVEQVRNAIAKQ